MLRAVVLGALMLSVSLAASGQAQAASPTTVFLQRGGGTLHAGWDNGAAGTSSLLAGHGIDRLQVPAYRGSDATWKQTVTCVRDRFSRFAVTVVDRRPSSGQYVTLMVGGHPSLIGYPKSVSGVAPYNGDLIATAIGFVFSDLLGNRSRAVCESAAHEIGHTLGLDHVRRCQDLMSYGNGCGAKSFVDQSMACGEFGDRRCADGQARQNSYRMLVEHVGLRASEPEPESESESESEPESEDWDGDWDGDWDADWDADGDWGQEDQGPGDGGWGSVDDELGGVELESDDATDDGSCEELDGERRAATTALRPASVDGIEVKQRWGNRGERVVEISVRASRAQRVELAWATAEELYLLRCDALPSSVPVTCQQRAGASIFTLRVGPGLRAYAIRVTGADGRQIITEPRTLRE